ncbi:hypothetical protein SAMN04487866_12228 [Thermoactinomyces sp. DSM 45891]|uniref:hypothetical protein n=1 Tax=Thermoactinomyces sp. DSM 45891 TaxID=1761907 RepID=UPI0009122CAE|nr:hypothetical protein [Thermoactinomyces sp. DSM 45891]SFX75008.1 hypothetical protein SAMN04487866_12228 [Thermoactinomyces sp. DSM 45891]
MVISREMVKVNEVHSFSLIEMEECWYPGENFEIAHYTNGKMSFTHIVDVERFPTREEALKAIRLHSARITGDYNGTPFRTYTNVTEEEPLQVGDLVADEIKDDFENCLPPAYDSPYLIQVGEPYSHVNGRDTYSTLKRTSVGWEYCGHCHHGEMVEPVRTT